jgi:hypothetical protein
MENLQIFKFHLPKKYEGYVTEGLVKGECHEYKGHCYFVQINLCKSKMESEGTNEDAVVIVAQSAKRFFGAVYHNEQEVLKVKTSGSVTMPDMINVLKEKVVTQEKEGYSGDTLTEDQQTLLNYLAQKPAKPQDLSDYIKNGNEGKTLPLAPTSNGKKYKATLFFMSVVALGFFAHKVHRGGIKLPSNLPSKQDILDSWAQFKEGFQSRLGSVKA